jgi:hypothetical protein
MGNQASISRRVRAPFLLLLLALVAVACAPQHLAQSEKVLLVGDSLMNGSREAVVDTLSSDGWDPHVEAISGTKIEDWSPKFGFLVGSFNPGVVVVELGTNDCSSAGCVNIGPYIDQVMNAIPASEPVLWLNVQEDVPPAFDVNRDYVNGQIEAADARWPNFYLVDFSGHFEDHPEWHGPDGLHFSDEGTAEFARFIADELDRFKGA